MGCVDRACRVEPDPESLGGPTSVGSNGLKMKKTLQKFTVDEVCRLWLSRQGLARPRGEAEMSPAHLKALLERVGALQLDSVNVVDRAHYLTLWSRFGAFDRTELDDWVHESGAAYEYWGHEASVLPISHLKYGLRRMRRFPPASWAKAAWWKRMATSTGSKRRVLRRIREEGPLESKDFERRPDELSKVGVWSELAPKEDKRSLGLLWHAGRLAVQRRRHFRRVYDLAERVYPSVEPACLAEYQDSWLLTGLSGNGITRARHLDNYFTAPKLTAVEKRRVIQRNLKSGAIAEVEVEGLEGPFYADPEQLATVESLPDPQGTTLLCPFDSLLWQRRRALDLLNFEYKIEIYVPASKRVFGYYAMPILHEGELVGRIDPKLHRERGCLEIVAIGLERGVAWNPALRRGLTGALDSLAEFSGASELELPKAWRRKLS